VRCGSGVCFPADVIGVFGVHGVFGVRIENLRGEIGGAWAEGELGGFWDVAPVVGAAMWRLSYGGWIESCFCGGWEGEGEGEGEGDWVSSASWL
jgi:hypothetical protein